MKDTIWAGKVHKLNYASEVPKGMSQGEGKNTRTLVVDQMREILAQHDDLGMKKVKSSIYGIQ